MNLERCNQNIHRSDCATVRDGDKMKATPVQQTHL